MIFWILQSIHLMKQILYLAKNSCPRFGSGAKGMFGESIRGKDLFIMVDVCNYSLTYTVNGHINHMSPDDHYQDLKRIISASTGKAHRVKCNYAIPLRKPPAQREPNVNLWTVQWLWKN